MMFDRTQIKTKAKLALNRNYWNVMLAAFVTSVFTEGTSVSTAGSGYVNGSQSTGNVSQDIQQDLHPSFSNFNSSLIEKYAVIIVIAILAAVILVRIFVSLTIETGSRCFFIRNQSEPENVKTVFSGFNKKDYLHTTGILLCRDIYLLLWSLLLIVPGIIKFYEYRMIPYIVADNPDISRQDAFALSKQMTDGHKMDLFILDLSFIGWHLLGAVTCGLGELFWTSPYVNCTLAEAYLYLKQENDDTIIDAEYSEENLY